MKHEIKHRLTGAVLFTADIPEGTKSGGIVRIALEQVVDAGADLSFADLSNADLRGSNLSYTDLSHADLRHADLRGANLSDADLSHANLSDADLSGADLGDVRLSHANLSDANLRGANLSYADLGGADMRNAKLGDAYLVGANLYGANLYGADLRDANLTPVKSKASVLSQTAGNQNVPTDAEILSIGPGQADAVWSYEDKIYFARALLAKYGQPLQTSEARNDA